MRRHSLFSLLLLVFGGPLLASAQQSGIVGTVADPSGAVPPAVTVAARNVNTGESRTATTGAVGEYAIPNLKIGTYEVSAEKQGFQRKPVDKVALAEALNRTIDFTLAPSAVGEQVNVTPPATALPSNDYFGDPDTTFGTPSFGAITSTRLDNREMRFSLRLVF